MNSAAAAFSAAPAAPTAPAGAASTGDPAASAPAAPAPAPAAPAGDQWYSGIANADVKTWVEAKGFKDAGSAAESAYNLEKLIGHDKAGRTLVLPKDDASPEEMAAFRTKLGVPDSPDGYKLPVPEGSDPAFAKRAASWMHEAGIPPKQAEILAAKWNEAAAETMQAQAKQQAAKSDELFTAVVAEWGDKAEQNLDMGRRAAAQYIPAATPAERQALIGKIESAIGTDNMLKMFANIGSNMGEHAMHDAGGGSGGMTVAGAQARITALKGDSEWGKRYVAGGAAEKQEMDRLHRIAYPEMK